jgi:hypothetical protein
VEPAGGLRLDTKPIVLVIAGVFSTIDALTNLPQAIGLLADA